MNKFKTAFISLWEEIQSPKTQLGKSSRDAVIFGLSGLAVLGLQYFDAIDFGSFDFIISSIVGGLVAKLNRETRTIKRES